MIYVIILYVEPEKIYSLVPRERSQQMEFSEVAATMKGFGFFSEQTTEKPFFMKGPPEKDEWHAYFKRGRHISGVPVTWVSFIPSKGCLIVQSAPITDIEWWEEDDIPENNPHYTHPLNIFWWRLPWGKYDKFLRWINRLLKREAAQEGITRIRLSRDNKPSLMGEARTMDELERLMKVLFRVYHFVSPCDICSCGRPFQEAPFKQYIPAKQTKTAILA